MTQPYWTHETLLFHGRFPTIAEGLLAIRGRWHQHEERYTAESARTSWLPLAPVAGTRLVIAIAPYLPAFAPAPEEPPKASHGGQVGVLHKRGARPREEHDLGIARGSVYRREHLLVLDECRFFPAWQAHREALADFWRAAEHLLLAADPDAIRLITPGHDPEWLDDDFQAFLQVLGYAPGKQGRFEKQLGQSAEIDPPFRPWLLSLSNESATASPSQ